jgi:hypothetical protein
VPVTFDPPPERGKAARVLDAEEGDELDRRIYDPWADPQPKPHPPAFYVGTSIAALYGGPMTPAQALQLAGWTIAPNPNHRRP